MHTVGEEDGIHGNERLMEFTEIRDIQQINKSTTSKKRCISLTRRHHNQTPQGIEIRLRDAYFGGNDVAEGIANGEGNVGGHRQKGIHLGNERKVENRIEKNVRDDDEQRKKPACSFILTHASMPLGANLAQTIKMGIVVNMPMISGKVKQRG